LTYIVIRDTREKAGHGWKWRKAGICLGTQVEKLNTGDYSLLGFENILAIERKGSVSEWANNIVKPRFERELERLALFQYAYVLLEFTESDVKIYPACSGIPRYKWQYLRFGGTFILKRTYEMIEKYPTIHFVFCGTSGKQIAKDIFETVASGKTIDKESSDRRPN